MVEVLLEMAIRIEVGRCAPVLFHQADVVIGFGQLVHFLIEQSKLAHNEKCPIFFIQPSIDAVRAHQRLVLAPRRLLGFVCLPQLHTVAAEEAEIVLLALVAFQCDAFPAAELEL